MQDGCEEIYPAILSNTLKGNEALGQLNNAGGPFVWKMYGPKSQNKNGKWNIVFFLIFQNVNALLASYSCAKM